MKKRKLSVRTQSTSVVIAGFGQNMVLTTVTTFMMMYLLEYARISRSGMAAVTVVITIAKIFDAVNDPIMGGIIDMTQTRWGKLRPYILLSAGPVAILSAALFCIPEISEVGKITFFAVCYILWDVAYTLCDVPYWGLIGSAFSDTADRTRVISLVRAFGAIALGLATLGAPWLARILSFSETTTGQGWSLAAILISVVGMGLFLLAFFNTRERPAKSEEKVTFKLLVSTLVKNKPMLMLMLGSMLGFGRNIVQVGGAVFAVIAYRDEGYFTLIGAAIIAGLAISSFVAPLILRRISSKALVMASSVGGAAAYLLMYVFGFSNIVSMMILIFFTGLSLGFFMVAQTAMIADSVDDIERRTGIRNEGISFSMLTFVSKLTGAIATMVFGIFIVWAGYEEGINVTAQMQHIVFLSITIVPAMSCLLSMVPFFFYKPETADLPAQ